MTGKIKEMDPEQTNLAYSVPPNIKNVPTMSLSDKDIYKELRLRGYNYSGMFRAIKSCDNGASVGHILWEDNYVTFMDNMLQLKILQEDSRTLFVPIGINRINIWPKKHDEYVKQFGENPLIPVYVNSDADTIRSEFIEIIGLKASPITRKKARAEPVLETYVFVPNDAQLELEQSVRVNLQLALENNPIIKVKIVEVPHANAGDDYEYLSPICLMVVGDLPLLQPEISVLSNNELDLKGITITKEPLSSETDCFMVVLPEASKTPQILTEALKVLKEDSGWIISRESLEGELNFGSDVIVVTTHTTPKEKLVLLKKNDLKQNPKQVLDISKEVDFDWLPTLQKLSAGEEDFVLVAEKDQLNGILGLVNCIRREPNGKKAKCVFVQDSAAPAFDANAKFYSKQLEKKLAVNVYKNGAWGTYRHLVITENPQVENEHAYVMIQNPGDFTTIKWVEGSLTRNSVVSSENQLVQIYYSSLNFRDIMTMSGRISVDVITRDRMKQSCVQGFEFSGRTLSGKRVFGLKSSGAMTSLIDASSTMIFDCPDYCTLAEAVTIPAVYGTVLYALIMAGNMLPGESILIHSGTGGIGQAAINVATFFGCKIFVTVGSKEKRDYIRQNFPQIRESHIGNSRDQSFEQMIKYHTKGKGVNLVLNSLAEEKLQASVRCLSKGGRFLEIGKFDLANDNQLQLEIFEKEIKFRSIMLDMTMDGDPSTKSTILKLITNGIERGFVKPLPSTIFKAEEVEQAVRYMSSGKHMGKVVLKIKSEEQHYVPVPKLFKCCPR